ncbi:hypothetical protein Ddye_001187 [Dipteronia dyeriana]|uniref:Uncharacterized protein n=1 Tax=Dipteronia dyeriana TaxID=168575 RepID=A0AAD9XNN8_9ROSI|nr:hypothetical protein Ddye_001187 [Dipteronia dyeriana]
MLKEVDQLFFLEDKTRFSQIEASRVVEWGLTGAFQVFEKLDKVDDKAIIQTRDKLMNQHILGEIDSRRPKKDIKVWE